MFLSLISGSSGNATLIKENNITILTDCGMSGKKLEQTLNSLDMSCTHINAILLTHEHIDHTKGAGIISRRFNIPIYATYGTFKNADLGKIDSENIHIISAKNDFEIGGIGVKPFRLTHDAAEPVGYSFFAGNKKMSIATDIGQMTNEIFEAVSGSDEIILESNHDPDMLMYGGYPISLKRRIAGRLGHLSNTDAAKTALRLLEHGTKKIMLGHLSSENNTPDIAYQTTKNELLAAGAKIGKDIFLSVANRYEVTDF